MKRLIAHYWPFVMTHMNPLHTLSSCFFKLQFKIIPPPSPRSSKRSFYLRCFMLELYFRRMHAAYPTHLFLTDLIETAARAWCSSICRLSHPPVPSAVVGRNVLLGTGFSGSPVCLCPITFERPGWYLNCSAWFMKDLSIVWTEKDKIAK